MEIRKDCIKIGLEDEDMIGLEKQPLSNWRIIREYMV